MLNLKELYKSDFFNLEISIENNKSDKMWFGELLIIRKDTGEEVRGGCSFYNNSKSAVILNIKSKISDLTQFLSTRPDDWNCRKRKVLSHCLMSGKSITNFALRLEKTVGPSRETEKLIDDFFLLCSKLTSDTIDIVKEIEDMEKKDRRELLTSKDEVYSNPSDPWNLDDLSSRRQIFKFFINPSSEEINLHESHQRRSG